MKCISIILSVCFVCVSTWSSGREISLLQDTLRPSIGEPCPDFKLDHVTHYSKKQVTLNDFKGKWLLLDFWFLGCTTCLKSFPKINDLQEEFAGSVQFLMVGKNDKKNNRNIEEVFEKLRKSRKLNIASAYDSVLGRRWGVHSMPHIVIIDPQGIVRHITDGRDLTRDKIQRLLDAKPVSFYVKDAARPEFDANSAADLDMKSSGDNLLYQSILTKWNGEQQYGGNSIDDFVHWSDDAKRNGFKFATVQLAWLYNVAYFGQYYVKLFGDPLYGKVCQLPILEVSDSSLFEYDFGEQSNLGKGLYNYSLTVPVNRVTKQNIMKYMQEDLERVFAYRASIEERDMPVWKLIIKPDAEIKSKGGSVYNSAGAGKSIAAGFVLKNVPMKTFMGYLVYYLNETEKYPFLDATGISGNVDITIDADMTNFQDIKKALNKQGMDLILSTSKMQVLIIRDP